MKDWAVVTGASSGIGRDLAIELAARGYHLVLVARSRPQLEQLAAEVHQTYGIDTHVVTLDLMNMDSAAALEKAVDQQGITVKILINNAGVGYQGKFIEQDSERIAKMMIVNMRTLTLLSHIFAKKMAAAGGGYIMQLGSVAAFQPVPRLAVYAGTKSYVLNFSRGLNYELRDKNVSVTVLCPGPTKTNFWNAASAKQFTFLADKVLMTSQKVAKIGVDGLLKKKLVVIPGFINRQQVFFTKFLPSVWLAALVDRTMP